MLVRHDFVTLYANGIRYLEKAPLFYWSMAACMKPLRSPWNRPAHSGFASSRSPSPSSRSRCCSKPSPAAPSPALRAGLYAGLITLSSFGIFIFSRINIPDVLVCVLLVVSLYAYFLTERSRSTPAARFAGALRRLPSRSISSPRA